MGHMIPTAHHVTWSDLSWWWWCRYRSSTDHLLSSTRERTYEQSRISRHIQY